MTVTPQQLGCRLRAIRTRLSLSQAEMAKHLGLRGRVQVSRIESGKRRVRSDELALAAQLGGVTTDHLLDPFHLEGEAEIQWDPPGAAGPPEAERWIAAYRWLRRITGTLPLLTYRLRLPLRATEAEIRMSANRVGGKIMHAHWVKDLVRHIFRTWAIPTFVVPTPERISGYCRLPELEAIVLSPALEPAEQIKAVARQVYRILAPEAQYTDDTAALWTGTLIDAVFENGLDDKWITAVFYSQSDELPGGVLCEPVSAALERRLITADQAAQALGIAGGTPQLKKLLMNYAGASVRLTQEDMPDEMPGMETT